jgi:Ser/Thr protein kinase RdoA (MazF antagonist)
MVGVHPNQRDPAMLPVELRRVPVTEHVRAWVCHELGASVVRVRRLAGASTTAVHALSLADGRRVVLRRYVWPGFLATEPDAPQREVDGLRFAAANHLPVPEVLAADLDGVVVGDAVPTMIMSMVPGTPVAVPDAHDLAEVAAWIHSIDASAFPHRYFRWHADVTEPPLCATDPVLWERAINHWLTAMPAHRPSFVHRDFHPGNVLWSRGAASVVDWANACQGPWGCDVAHCRYVLMRLDGEEAADRFLSAYESVTGETFDPFWEIASTLEHSPSSWTPFRIARSESRLAAAIAALG